MNKKFKNHIQKECFCFKRGSFSCNLNQRCSNFPYLTTCPMGRLWLGGGGYTAGDNNICT